MLAAPIARDVRSQSPLPGGHPPARGEIQVMDPMRLLSVMALMFFACLVVYFTYKALGG